MKTLIKITLAFPLLCVPVMAFAGNWTNWGGGPRNDRHAKTESKIDVNNAAGLKVAWTFTSLAHGNISATPTVYAGKVYVPDMAGYLYRLDAKTGVLEWAVEIPGAQANLSRTSPAIQGDKLIIGNRTPIGAGGDGAVIMALDRNTGAEIWSTSLDGHLAAVITQSPTIHGNTVFVGVSSTEEVFAADGNYPCCTFRGSFAALNLTTGEIIWQTHMTPEAEPGKKGYSGVAVWGSSPAVDLDRNLVYVATGNNYTWPDDLADCLALADDDTEATQVCFEMYDDPDTNLFDAIVALDMDDGTVVWATKPEEGPDTWNVACVPGLPGLPEIDPKNCPDVHGPDHDFAQAPMLWEADGQAFVGAGRKSGWFFALDRDTGAEIWSTEVGPGGEAGGMQWGSATDGERIYAGISNFFGQKEYKLFQGPKTHGGSWSALDPVTGEFLWQTADPGCKDGEPCAGFSSIQAPLTVANGVLFGASTAGGLHALNAETGEILRSLDTGAANLSGAAVVDGMVFWGSGYDFYEAPGNNAGNTLYALRP